MKIVRPITRHNMAQPDSDSLESRLDSAVANSDVGKVAALIRDSITGGHTEDIIRVLKTAMEEKHSISRGAVSVVMTTALGMQELGGLDTNPLDVLSSLEGVDPQKAYEMGRKTLMQSLEDQIRKKNTFFIDVERLWESEAAILAGEVINARRAEVRELVETGCTIEQFASTYYGFLFFTTEVRKDGLVMNHIGELLECLDISTDNELNMSRSELNPEKVRFNNVSERVEELLRCILYLTGSNSAERARAATRLGQIGNPVTERYLARATHDEHSWVRKEAVRALGRIRMLKDPGCVVEVLKDIDEDTRNAALESVIAMGSGAVPFLLDILENYKGISFEDALKMTRKTHSRSLDNLEAQLQYHSQNVRALAATALGRIGDRRAAPKLEEIAHEEEPEVRAAALDALRAIKES